MQLRRFNLLVLWLMVCVAALAAGACGKKPTDRGTHYYIFPDRSGSIQAMQAAEFLKAAAKFASQLQSGDAVTVIPVHANTTSAPVLFDEACDAVDDGAGYEAAEGAVAALAAMKGGFLRAMESVFSGQGTSPQTDLFGLVDRVHADPVGRRILIVVLSDMEHSTAEVDMGRVRITDQGTPELIRGAAKRRNWQGGELSGATVMCILPSHDGKPRSARNDLQTLKRFWTVFFGALGAKVTVFDNHI